MDHILQLPVHVQVALAGGYMGYTTAYSGIKSRHSARDALLLTLVFGLFSSLPYLALMSVFQVSSDGVVTLFSVLAAVLAVICPSWPGYCGACRSGRGGTSVFIPWECTKMTVWRRDGRP